MTIIDAITQIDNLKKNTYSQKQKIAWLSRLESMVKRLVIDTHEGGENVSFGGFNENTDVQTVLLMPEPFDQGYLYWLEAQIHYANQEEDRCNNATDAFKALWTEFCNDYNRKHMPLGQKLTV